ncbi:hypothetical protein [Amycolatopsis jiangsuensis]|uniref:PE family protein n=1 Tax=Amycolatopsis jiangsuensis TaxID=1181879 RepID=A0A840J5F8_9PSEU|nr:hypothetical protein [Amycolatopsis jiangsuensis]MBB4688624.1 hypothetical protein [Amycolatopsis jiangsuensis]
MAGDRPQPEQPKIEVPPVPPIQVDGYGPGGGYKFDADQIDGVIKQWEDMLADVQEDLQHAVAIRDVKPPADEVASHTFVSNGAFPSGETLVAQHQAMVDYTKNFVTALRAAKNKITVEEQNAADAANLKKSGDL